MSGFREDLHQHKGKILRGHLSTWWCFMQITSFGKLETFCYVKWNGKEIVKIFSDFLLLYFSRRHTAIEYSYKCFQCYVTCVTKNNTFWLKVVPECSFDGNRKYFFSGVIITITKLIKFTDTLYVCGKKAFFLYINCL